MQIPAIKKLVDKHSPEEVEKAEEAILSGEEPEISVDGKDEGEKLTHIIAAKWIQEAMSARNLDFKSALREYSRKVRQSIS